MRSQVSANFRMSVLFFGKLLSRCLLTRLLAYLKSPTPVVLLLLVLRHRKDHPINMRFWRTLWRFFVAIQLLPALEGGEETLVGGQAVLEGVMMRSPHAWAIACRKPSGEVSTHSEPLERLSEKHKWMGWPVVRGVMTLGHAMTLGFRALKFSANVALDELRPAPEPGEPEKKKLEISGWIAAVNIIFSVGFFIFMYKFLPLLATTELKRVNPVFGRAGSFQSGGRPYSPALIPALYLGHIAVERHSPGVRVSRRRAQNCFRLRERRPAKYAFGAEIYDLSPALRNQLFDDRDDNFDFRIHAGAGHHILGAFCGSHCAAARDYRAVVRDNSFRRQASRIAIRPHDRAGLVDAANHH